MVTLSTEAGPEMDIRRSMDLPLLVPSLELARVRSAALITAEMPEAFPLEGNQVLEAASTEVPMAVVAGIR